jgi:cytochrome c553
MRTATASIALTLGLLPLAAAAQGDKDQLYVRSMAASCAQCHGTDGRPAEGSPVAALAGMPAAYMTAQMQAFKTGARQATVMHQLAKGYSDQQIAQLAAWFAAQKK